jgi:hypothetical protein
MTVHNNFITKPKKKKRITSRAESAPHLAFLPAPLAATCPARSSSMGNIVGGGGGPAHLLELLQSEGGSGQGLLLERREAANPPQAVGGRQKAALPLLQHLLDGMRAHCLVPCPAGPLFIRQHCLFLCARPLAMSARVPKGTAIAAPSRVYSVHPPPMAELPLPPHPCLLPSPVFSLPFPCGFHSLSSFWKCRRARPKSRNLTAISEGREGKETAGVELSRRHLAHR